MNGGRDRGRPHLQWYTAKRTGDRRLDIKISRDLANALAVRHGDAIEELCALIEDACMAEDGLGRYAPEDEQ